MREVRETALECNHRETKVFILACPVPQHETRRTCTNTHALSAVVLDVLEIKPAPDGAALSERTQFVTGFDSFRFQNPDGSFIHSPAATTRK